MLCFVRKDFIWNDEAESTFISLKHHLTTIHVLRLPNFSIQFIVETDASVTAMGAVLQQQNHPIAYFSHAFPPCFLNESAYDKGMCSIVESIKHWHHYLLGY